MAAITQQKFGLWSRVYGSFAGKIEATIDAIDVATVDLGSTTAQSAVNLGATTAQPTVNWVAKTRANTLNLGPTLRDQ